MTPREKQMKFREAMQIVALSFACVTLGACSYKGAEFLDHLNTEEVVEEVVPNEVVSIVADDDADTMEIYDDKLVIKYDGEITAELYKQEDGSYCDDTFTYNLFEPKLLQCPKGETKYLCHPTWCDLDIWYTVNDENAYAEYVLVRKGANICEDVIAAYSTTKEVN